MTCQVNFCIRAWSAWAKGLDTREAWRVWAEGSPASAPESGVPQIKEFSSMLTRRASTADRLALRAALDCQGEAPLVTVFASRHGEVHRSVELLAALSRGEAFSPTTFSLSVHNAAAGFFSLGRGDLSASSSVASGRDSLPMAVLEACGLLAEGQPRVLLVAYDERVPAEFSPYLDEADFPVGAALLLEASGAAAYSLELLAEATGMSAPTGSRSEAPHLAEFLRFLATGELTELSVPNQRRGWRWRRSA